MTTPQDNIPDKLPAQSLYHYSSPGGMLGMLESKSLWMSNIRYQNDAEEYKYAFKLFREIIRDEYKGLNLEQKLDHFKDEFVPPIFTFSLTEQGDLLSQWRGYAPEGGYSFCLDKAQLNWLINKGLRKQS